MIQTRYDAASFNPEEGYTAGWEFKQAHKNGRLSAFEEIYKLLP